MFQSNERFVSVNPHTKTLRMTHRVWTEAKAVGTHAIFTVQLSSGQMTIRICDAERAAIAKAMGGVVRELAETKSPQRFSYLKLFGSKSTIKLIKQSDRRTIRLPCRWGLNGNVLYVDLVPLIDKYMVGAPRKTVGKLYKLLLPSQVLVGDKNRAHLHFALALHHSGRARLSDDNVRKISGLLGNPASLAIPTPDTSEFIQSIAKQNSNVVENVEGWVRQ